MIKKFISIIAASVVSIAMMESAMALGSMRCGTHIVSSDPSLPTGKYDVLKRCGEPTVRYGDAWIYERGSVKHTVTFSSNGRVKDIF